MLGNELPPRLDHNCPLFDATAARRRAEQDAILLANRIRLLKSEEEKTRRKIKETEKRTKDVVHVRQRQEEQRALREAEAARKEVEEQERRERLLRERDVQQRKINMKSRSIQNEKHAMVREVKQQREINQQLIEEERKEQLAIAQMKHERVSAALQHSAKQRTRSEGAKHEVARSMVEERLQREEADRKNNLALIEQMEQEEASLIAKLQRSQERHRVAYQQLEDALAQPSTCSTPKRCIEASAYRPPRPRGRDSLTPTRSSPANLPPSMPSSVASASGSAHERLGVSHGTVKRPPVMRPASDLSTTSGGHSTTSGQSTPSSTAPQMTYTTVDGTQLEIGIEDDLDLAAILNT